MKKGRIGKTSERAGKNKTLMRKIVKMFETGDLSNVAAVIAGEYVDHQGVAGTPITGRDGFGRVVQAARAGFSELDVSVKDLIAEDDRVVARLWWRGTRPTGEWSSRETIDIIRFAGGRAAEHWGARVRPQG